MGVKVIEYTEKSNQVIVPLSYCNKTTHSKDMTVAIREAKSEELRTPEVAEHGAEGAEHHYENPTGTFQWNDPPMLAHLTDFEKTVYLTPDGKLNQRAFESKVRIFFWIYFVMTGLHALHMIIGLGIMTWLLWKAWKGSFSANYYAPVEISGLYWHFVDIVWIFLFPLLYLLGRHFLEHTK